MNTPVPLSCAALVLLSSCCAAPAMEPTPSPPAIVTPATVAPAIGAIHAASAAVVRSFDAARGREIAAVFRPEITRDQIIAIHAADIRARAALTALGRQRDRVTLPVLNDARAAVRALEAALESPKPANKGKPP